MSDVAEVQFQDLSKCNTCITKSRLDYRPQQSLRVLSAALTTIPDRHHSRSGSSPIAVDAIGYGVTQFLSAFIAV